MTHRPVALLTYSTKPRGGVVHTLELAEALSDLGVPVRVVALGDPGAGFFRPVRVPVTLVPGPVGTETLEEKVAGGIDCLEGALAEIVRATPDVVLHAQDCMSARAAARVRDAGSGVPVVRTVHHVDDFSSAMLMDCQRQAILEPDVVLAVTEVWRGILERDYGVASAVVPNGVDVRRFATASQERAAELRRSVGAADRPLILGVGGIEPRKGTDDLVRAVADLRSRTGLDPVLAVVGGHSFQDYKAYRDRVLAELPSLGLVLGRDIVQVGTVPEADMAAWYAAADLLAFPSVKEGFGLAVLEAMAAGTPVVTSDLPVFREYLVDGRDALLVPVGNVPALSSALEAVLRDTALRTRLVAAGTGVAQAFTWPASGRRHLEVYADLPSTARV
ncbi:MAG: glycosyl transferase group 1 [Frankiales bacterium]|nr:glycosyl transferase group 1 [Frankiales bacterium]